MWLHSPLKKRASPRAEMLRKSLLHLGTTEFPKSGSVPSKLKHYR